MPDYCHLDWEKSRLSHQLRRMAERGLVARTTCSDDGRAAIVQQTGPGRQAVADATECHRSAVRRWFADALTAQRSTDQDDIAAAILAGLGTSAHTTNGDR